MTTPNKQENGWTKLIPQNIGRCKLHIKQETKNVQKENIDFHEKGMTSNTFKSIKDQTFMIMNDTNPLDAYLYGRKQGEKEFKQKVREAFHTLMKNIAMGKEGNHFTEFEERLNL
jgi:hypothetical protein